MVEQKHILRIINPCSKVWSLGLPQVVTQPVPNMIPGAVAGPAVTWILLSPWRDVFFLWLIIVYNYGWFIVVEKLLLLWLLLVFIYIYNIYVYLLLWLIMVDNARLYVCCTIHFCLRQALCLSDVQGCHSIFTSILDKIALFKANKKWSTNSITPLFVHGFLYFSPFIHRFPEIFPMFPSIFLWWPRPAAPWADRASSSAPMRWPCARGGRLGCLGCLGRMGEVAVLS